MISRLVSVDLLLTASQRLGQLSECQGSDLKGLYEGSKMILNDWAQRIEREGLGVSLQTILENTFFFTQPNTSIRSVLDMGHQMIDCAGQIESFLRADRMVQPMHIQSLQELETAVRDEQKIEWFDGAKQITGLKNSTEASDSLKRALARYLGLHNPPENSTLLEFLSKATNGKQPRIPSAFVSLFRDRYYSWLQALGGVQARREKRNAAKST